MNATDAQLAIHDFISELLAELGAEEGESPDAELLSQMQQLTDLIFEGLTFHVESVEGKQVVASIKLP